MQILDCPFEIKSVEPPTTKQEGERATFSGLGAVFGNIDQARDIIEPGAFRDSLKERMPKLLWQHDSRQPIGIWTAVQETKQGLAVTGELLLDLQQGQEAHALLKARALDGLSIGFKVVDSEINEKTGIRHIKAVDLWEVSIVTFPANERARVGRVKAYMQDPDNPTKREVQDGLRDFWGMSQSEAKTLLAGGWNAYMERRKPGTVEREILDAARRLTATMRRDVAKLKQHSGGV